MEERKAYEEFTKPSQYYKGSYMWKKEQEKQNLGKYVPPPQRPLMPSEMNPT